MTEKTDRQIADEKLRTLKWRLHGLRAQLNMLTGERQVRAQQAIDEELALLEGSDAEGRDTT